MSAGWRSQLEALVDGEVPLKDGDRLFRAGDSVRWIFIVRRGCVLLERTQSSGDPLVLQRVTEGGLLAEASLFAGRYHCDAVASGVAVAGRIPKSKVLVLQDEDPGWLRAFAGHLASEVQRTRARAQLLALKRVDARLDAWLAFNGGALPERGHWTQLAFELAITPEALYREIAKRRGRMQTAPRRMRRSGTGDDAAHR